MASDHPDLTAQRLAAWPMILFLVWPMVLTAQIRETEKPANEELIEEIIVSAQRVYRNRETMPAPTLIYDHAFFKQFEPVAVGDMLKRVSGVSFSGDIGEFDAAQLRGLATRYTQILINGNRVPGAGADRSVLVNRIPYELVDRIEIIRSPSADLDAQGVGGTLNIILRDAAVLDGGAWRINGSYYGDQGFKGAASVSYGGSEEAISYSIAANYQQRLTPKTKTETSFDDEGEFAQQLNSRDSRQTTDASVTATLGFDLAAAGILTIEASHIDTAIDEDEFIEAFDEEMELEEQRSEHERFDQQRSALAARHERQLDNGMDLELALSLARFEEDASLREGALEDGTEIPDLLEDRFTRDDEVLLDAALAWQALNRHELEVGLSLGQRQRDARQSRFEIEDEELEDTSPGSGSYAVEETRMDLYFKDTWQVSDALTLEYGVRLEDTDLEQMGLEGRASQSRFEILPSAHLIFQAGDTHQFRFSLAETVRRPGFDEIVPFVDQDSPGEDQITIGNPKLSAERALGFDLGYEYRFPAHEGIFGANFFYRDIKDKIELTQIDDDLFTPDNVADGQTWGVELDLSMPLSFIGLPQLGLYANYTWLDSEINDPFSGLKRQFNGQPDTVANLDLIHALPAWGMHYGLSYQKQSSSSDFQATETAHVQYGANLEFLIEKELSKTMTIRFTINNILDAKKKEETFLYDSPDNRVAGEFAERALETEQTNPIFLLTLRGQF